MLYIRMHACLHVHWCLKHAFIVVVGLTSNMLPFLFMFFFQIPVLSFSVHPDVFISCSYVFAHSSKVITDRTVMLYGHHS